MPAASAWRRPSTSLRGQRDDSGNALLDDDELLLLVEQVPGVGRAPAREGLLTGQQVVDRLARDDLARFVRPGTVVIAQEKNKRDPNYQPLRENWARLQKMRDARGKT